MLQDIVDFLIENSKYINRANIFINILPDSPTNATKIERSDGGYVSDSGILRKIILRVVIRNSEYMDAEIIAEDIILLLHNKQHLTDAIKYCKLIGEIENLGSTDKNDVLLSLKFECTTIIATEEE